MIRSNFNSGLLLTLFASMLLSACGSGRLKARQEQREKAVNATGLFCEWVNGDRHSDFDVEVNLQMAKRCDSSKPFSLVPFKNSSDQNGIMYCCATPESQGGGHSYAPPVPRRTTGPAVRRMSPQPAAQPAMTPPPAPAAAPVQQAVPANTNSEAADLTQDEIVEDK